MIENLNHGNPCSCACLARCLPRTSAIAWANFPSISRRRAMYRSWNCVRRYSGGGAPLRGVLVVALLVACVFQTVCAWPRRLKLLRQGSGKHRHDGPRNQKHHRVHGDTRLGRYTAPSHYARSRLSCELLRSGSRGTGTLLHVSTKMTGLPPQTDSSREAWLGAARIVVFFRQPLSSSRRSCGRYTRYRCGQKRRAE